MSSSGAGSSSEMAANVPPEPPKLRPKPQEQGNIGNGKLYADKAAFTADVEKWKQEPDSRKQLTKEREKALDKLRDRSERQRDPSDSARRVKQRRVANTNLLPQPVVDMFDHLRQGEWYRWCERGCYTPEAVAAGLQGCNRRSACLSFSTRVVTRMLTRSARTHSRATRQNKSRHSFALGPVGRVGINIQNAHTTRLDPGSVAPQPGPESAVVAGAVLGPTSLVVLD
jgi:hypothetical protein